MNNKIDSIVFDDPADPQSRNYRGHKHEAIIIDDPVTAAVREALRVQGEYNYGGGGPMLIGHDPGALEGDATIGIQSRVHTQDWTGHVIDDSGTRAIEDAKKLREDIAKMPALSLPRSVRGKKSWWAERTAKLREKREFKKGLYEELVRYAGLSPDKKIQE